MKARRNPLIGLCVVMFLTTIASAQQARHAPTMSSDEMAGAPSTKPHIVPKKPDDGTPSSWNRYSLEGCGLAVSLPGEPFTMDETLPDQIKRVIISGKDHVYEGNGFAVAAVHAVVGVEIPLKLVAEAFMEHIGQSAEVSNLKYTVGVEKSGHVPVKGSYTEGTSPKEFEGFAEAHGNNLWIVLAMYDQPNKSAALDAHRALSSAAFDGPECSDQ